MAKTVMPEKKKTKNERTNDWVQANVQQSIVRCYFQLLLGYLPENVRDWEKELQHHR